MMYYRLLVAILAASAIVPCLLFLKKYRPPREYSDVGLSQRLMIVSITLFSLSTAINYFFTFLNSDVPAPGLGRIIITVILIAVAAGSAWWHYIVYLRRR